MHSNNFFLILFVLVIGVIGYVVCEMSTYFERPFFFTPYNIYNHRYSIVNHE